jgi:hypothetical protein
MTAEAFDYHCACGAFATGFASRQEASNAADVHTCLSGRYPTRRAIWIGPAGESFLQPGEQVLRREDVHAIIGNGFLRKMGRTA